MMFNIVINKMFRYQTKERSLNDFILTHNSGSEFSFL